MVGTKQVASIVLRDGKLFAMGVWRGLGTRGQHMASVKRALSVVYEEESLYQMVDVSHVSTGYDVQLSIISSCRDIFS